MAWFTRSTKKKIVPEREELWIVCHSCKAHVFKQEWENGLQVCPKCNFHDKITYQQRLELLLDGNSFRELNADISITDHLNFTDASGSYKEKATATAKKLGMNESVVTGRGKINDIAVVIAVMDFRFLGGSLSSGAGEKILLAAEYALKHRLPYIVVSASGGARMHEGIVSLMQMARTCAAIERLHAERIPYISILTHPTTGGVSASFAMIGDIHIAEPGALIGFAGRRVIEETIKQKLPDDFQTAEYLLDHGFVDAIVSRKEMKDFLTRYLGYWNQR